MSRMRIVCLSWVVVVLVGSVPADAGLFSFMRRGESRDAVRVWEEPLTLPTYRLDPEDPNPRFYTNESYQGAQKRIYPYPMQDGVTNIREEQTYKALYLENEYIKLCILPEIGGRLWYATDKTNGYEIFYRQNVVKPALIGMLGAWVSGGIEWCVFHHHRDTTHLPVDYHLAENADGSKTIWFGETERRHRMRWLIGVTLRPGKSYIETTVKIFNRTAYPHSILYWANVAVHANEDYQVLFPPSVTAVTYHSKNHFAHWPHATGSFRGIDYRGVDLSWWKNHPEPISFFAWGYREDFMGGYDHDRRAGTIHVANHHVVCGAKLWEWGPGPTGQMWDKILTDEDGPYIELMVGAWSDNQPDYSWVKPHEVKVFNQYWYPIREIGGFKNANLRGAVNLEVADGAAKMGFNTTARHENARAVLEAGGITLFERTISIGPESPFVTQVTVPPGFRAIDLRATLLTRSGETLISYQPVEIVADPTLPEPVRPPAAPKDIATIEELYLTGLRMEQMHSPRVDPFDYYEEALRRDPDDTRTNTMVGINYSRRGMFEKAEQHLRRAVVRLSAEYTRPGDTQALYHLGLALRAQGKYDEAYNMFNRAAWDYAFRSPSYYQLAELSCRKGQFDKALEHINQSLTTNSQDTKARNLRAAVLTRLDRAKEAADVLAKVLEEDPLDFLARNELSIVQRRLASRRRAETTLRELETAMRRNVQAYLELATDYMNWGFWDEAIDVLTRVTEDQTDFAGSYPLVYYYLGFLHEQKGDTRQASELYAAGAWMPSTYCFPFRAESAVVLQAAVARNPRDARAHYYLGNLLYERQPERAIEHWERSVAIDSAFATAHRNLGWAYYRTQDDVVKAIASYEKAIASDSGDPRLFAELDELYEVGNTDPKKRMALLEKHHATVIRRNDSYARRIMAQVLSGRYDEAIDALTTHHFHVREGGGEIRDVYVDAYLLRGLSRLRAGNPEAALEDFQAAAEYPENLSIGRPRRDPRAAQIAYYTALAHETAGEMEQAGLYYTEVSQQQARTPEARFYRALCLRKLDRDSEAEETFEELIRTGAERLTRGEKTDVFAKFGEEQARQARLAAAHYIVGLGHLGKRDHDTARTEFGAAAELNLSHVWARAWLATME